MSLINFKLMLHLYTPRFQGVEKWKTGMKQVGGVQEEAIFFQSHWNRSEGKDRKFQLRPFHNRSM